MTMIEPELRQYLDVRTFKMIVFPTTACNLRCTYCYQDHSPTDMAPEMVEALKRFLDRRIAAGLELLNIEFFGGEPSLRLRSVVLPLSRYARDAGITFIGAMTTNFVLIDAPVLDELLDVGVSTFQVTLDGPEQLHDSHRTRPDGGGTYDRIMANIISAHRSDRDLSILLRLHYRPDTWRRVGEFAEHLVDVLDADARFRFHFHPVSRLGGDNDDQIEPVPAEEMAAIEKALARGVPAAMRSTTDRASHVCYACTSALAFNVDGTVYKCTVCLENEHNHIGRLLSDGRLEVDQDLHRAWLAPLFVGPEARSCPYSWLRENVPDFAGPTAPHAAVA